MPNHHEVNDEMAAKIREVFSRHAPSAWKWLRQTGSWRTAAVPIEPVRFSPPDLSTPIRFDEVADVWTYTLKETLVAGRTFYTVECRGVVVYQGN